MKRRKCIYTGNDSDCTDHVIAKQHGDDPVHNWSNKVPASKEYLKNRKGNLPTDLEMEASRLFHLLEIARNEVTYLELKLKEVQDKITGRKSEEIEKAHHIKDLTESFEEQLAKTEKKNLWE